MIKRIASITNFGIYSDFKWNQVDKLKEFEVKNILYGWNYSGKTTLSRIFSSLKNTEIHPDYTNAQFSIQTDSSEYNQDNILDFPYSIEVFNSEYVRDNLDWEYSEEMRAIEFEVGENVRIKKEIDEKRKRIDEIKGTDTVKGEKEQYKSAISALNNLESRYTSEARKIKNEAFLSLIEFRKDHLKKIRSEIKNDLDAFVISQEDELSSLRETVKISGPKSPIEKIHYELDYSNVFKQVEQVLVNEPKKEDVIDILDKDQSIYHWAETGVALHENKEKCGFCNNPLTETRLSQLKNYFENQASQLKREVEGLIKMIKDKCGSIEDLLNTISHNDFNKGFQEEYLLELTNYNNLKTPFISTLNEIVELLTEKLNSKIYTKMTLSVDMDSAILFSEQINSLNDLIIRNNKFSEEFDNLIQEDRGRYQKHLVAVFLKEIDYLSVEQNALKAQDKLDDLDNEIERLSSDIKTLEGEIKSMAKGRDQFNDFVKVFLSRDDLMIELSTSEDSFILKRAGKSARNLSEGEKSAIAFAYFLVYLESLHSQGKLRDTIIFIDDPISSLDSNHIAKVYSIINSFFFRKGLDPDNSSKVINCFRQLFISTHSFEFFSFLKDSNPIKRKRKATGEDGITREVSSVNYYFIKKINSQSSTISPLPKSLKRYKSEYVHLFSLIHSFYHAGCDLDDENFILMPNAIRRFLEMYSLMKLPHTADEFDNRLKELSGDDTNIKFLHHFSHFTSFEKLIKYDDLISTLPDATKELFDLLEKDKAHLNSLIKAI